MNLPQREILVQPWQPEALDAAQSAPYAPGEAQRVLRFHRSMQGYAPTPLHSLPALAALLGVRAIYVKDESPRFGLNAFKALGGSWAAARWVAERVGLDDEHLNFAALTSPNVRERLQGLTLVTTTDGNHGRGIAWVARQLGLPAIVHMPKGTAQERVDNIRALGATVEVSDLNYDDTVRLAARTAREVGGALMQDTAWPGYEQVPRWIMQGYTTIASEAREQVTALGDAAPTHLFLQAGAGSFAGALAACWATWPGQPVPRIAVLEPHAANCFYATARAADGQLHAVGGDLRTIMAGLSVGEPSTLAWPLLAGTASWFLSCADEVAALGMRVLASPLGQDPRIIAGESGAVGAGVLAAACLCGQGNALREILGLDEHASVLLINTEGDTDRENWRKVVWGC